MDGIGNYTLANFNQGYLKSILASLERVLEWTGCDVSIIYDERDNVIEVTDLRGYTHALIRMTSRKPLDDEARAELVKNIVETAKKMKEGNR